MQIECVVTEHVRQRYLKFFQRQLKYQAMAWEVRVQACLRKIRHRDVWLKLDTTAQIRLLNLKVWTLRYNVSLEFILTTLIRYYQKHNPSARTSSALGFSPAQLCGRASEEIVREAVKEQMPDNASKARADLRHKMVGAIRPIPAPKADDNLDTYCQHYQRWCEKRRSKAERAADKFRRPWRGNPWR